MLDIYVLGKCIAEGSNVGHHRREKKVEEVFFFFRIFFKIRGIFFRRAER